MVQKTGLKLKFGLTCQQDGRVEGSPLLTKTPKSQLIAEQPLTKTKTKQNKTVGTYQKRYPTSKDKATTSHPPGGQHMNW